MKRTTGIFFKTTGIILCLSIFCAASCSKNKNINQQDSQQAELNAGAQSDRPQWQPSAKKICVVFGYGYNSENFINQELERLEKNFGISDGTENSGLIIPYVFPDDFKVGNTGRISKLISMLKDVKIAGIITLGAPEYTNNTLAVFRENMEDGNEFPIYTLFPQDDILAIEATSDFVLDKAVEQSDNVQEIKEESEQIIVDEIEDIIDNAIDYMLLFEKPLKSNSELRIHVNNIAGANYKIKRYVDPETGLSSINHFIIENKEQ